MEHIVGVKTNKFHKPGFAKHPTSWLLIYDNWDPVSLLRDEIATKRLNRKLCESDASNPFQRVFIQRPRTVWEFSGGAIAIEHGIPGAWLARWPDE